MHCKSFIIPLLLLLTLLPGCSGATSQSADSAPDHEEENAVYYWKTTFNVDTTDMAFLSRNHVRRMYMRMFDVAADPTATNIYNHTYPDATIRFSDYQYQLLTKKLFYMEVVPVVYITLDALKSMRGHEDMLAENIVTRVRNMCSYNGLPNVGELQLDCDWTASTEESFFNLCRNVRECIDTIVPGEGWRLSSTIRLHQLARKVPPVDRGVLMVYNTGNFKDPDAKNSIIDPADVEPYLKHLPDYQLHLDVAYPTYSWQLLYHNREFAGLLNGLDLSDTTRFSPRSENLYAVKKDTSHNGRILRAGTDLIRAESSDYSDISRVKGMIESRLGRRPHSNILYHLDSKNLSKYSDDEIMSLYSTDN